MADDDKDLPLHDEAQAREKWRGGNTIIGKGEDGALPASEVDHAAQGGDDSDAAPVRPDVTRRPPD